MRAIHMGIKSVLYITTSKYRQSTIQMCFYNQFTVYFIETGVVLLTLTDAMRHLK